MSLSLNLYRGNVIDMYDRRARAYELANIYAAANNIVWDGVLYIRLDSATYEPQ